MELDVRLLYVSRYDFIDDSTGQVIKGCKLTYSTKNPVSDEDRVGFKINTCTLPYEKFDELKALKFPHDAKVVLELVDLDKKPKVKDVII